MNPITVYDRIGYVANRGLFDVNLKLWKRQIKRLREDGFFVSVLYDTNMRGLYYCSISFKNPPPYTKAELYSQIAMESI